MRVVIPDDYQNAVRTLDCFKKLTDHQVTIYQDSVKDEAILAERFREADALVLIRERTRITDSLLVRLPNLKLICQTGRGISHIDLKGCKRRGIPVAIGGGSPYATAELTWALILASLRHIPQEVAALKAGKWQATLGTGLRGRTLGIYGYGKIGAVVAGYGRVFGMDVQIWGREGSLERAAANGFRVAADRTAFFATSDVLSLHVKLVNDTHGLITADDLTLMKPSALLVNTSRAELIVRDALIAALRAGRPGYAAIDVYEHEPAIGDPLLELPNLLGTPHLGYVEKDNYELYFGTAFDQLLAFIMGRPIETA
jgi:D-3-phosphoglycerate dehydrogenase